MQIQEMSSPQCSNTERLFWYSLHLSRIEFFIPEQILEYEDHKNDSESDYEEYEMYEDSFDFAERDRAQTWNGEVNRKSELNTYNTSSEWSHLKLPVSSDSNSPYLFIWFSSSG